MCTCVHFHTHKFLHITIHQHSRTLLWHAKINIIEQDSCAAAIGGTLVWAFLSLDLIKICCPYFETMLKNVILIFKDIISLQLCFIVTTQWLAEFVSTKKLIKLFLFLVHLLQYSLGWLNYSLSKPFTTLKSHSLKVRDSLVALFWLYLRRRYFTQDLASCKQLLLQRKAIIITAAGSGCGSVGRGVASETRGPRFESSHRQKCIFILNICLMSTVFWKDENKEK